MAAGHGDGPDHAERADQHDAGQRQSGLTTPFAELDVWKEVLALPRHVRADLYRDPSWRNRARPTTLAAWSHRWSKIDIEETNKTFMEWEHHKMENIMGFRDNAYKSLMTGTMAPKHHTKWMEAMDDSLESYLQSK